MPHWIPPHRTLMGPGPSDVAPQVLEAMAQTTIGHLDPSFVALMDEVGELLRHVFQTHNPLTLPMSGTGMAGMETCMVNLVAPGDRVLVGVNGVFGTRLADIAGRLGGEVIPVECPWGQTFVPEDFAKAAAGQGAKVLALVHAETSTGALQDLAGFREVADSLGALLLVDTVTSLGTVPLAVDDWGLDAVYSGTQKGLSCPPGLAPVTFSARATEQMDRRSKPIPSFYLDLSLIKAYWGKGKRAYHHTAPINMVYGLHEALCLVQDEGLSARWERHARLAKKLWAGLEALGLELMVPLERRLPPLTAVHIPEGVDDATVRGSLLDDFNLEIGGGLGAFAGKAWRIGLMGQACSEANIELCLKALATGLNGAGFACSAEEAQGAADSA